MERITEDQIKRLVEFIKARMFDVASLQDEDAHRAAAALRLIVHKQIGVIRYYQAVPPEAAAAAESHAIASWNLLVDVARVWRDHPDFPADAAVLTYDLDAEHPIMRQTFDH